MTVTATATLRDWGVIYVGCPSHNARSFKCGTGATRSYLPVLTLLTRKTVDNTKVIIGLVAIQGARSDRQKRFPKKVLNSYVYRKTRVTTDHELDHLHDLDPNPPVVRCCAGSVQYRFNSGNLPYRSCRLYGSHPAT